MVQITRIDTRRDDVHQQLSALREQLSPRGDVVSPASRQRTLEVFGEPLSPREVVERICGQVRSEGVDAVLRYSRLLDRAELTGETLQVSADELAAAHAQADPEFLATIRRIRQQIEVFQRAILHSDTQVELPPGIRLRQRYVPLQRIGICIPGGAAAYPSTVLMTAVPAQVAGVPQIAVVAPPTPYGAYNKDLLATCQELGISEVYRVGGAQGIAALAYGVAGIPAVDKIVGPGNLFVALAKQFVYGQVDIDSIAGPSEVVIIADDQSRADFVAADMLAQAEHSPGASILISWDDRLLDQTLAELDRQLPSLSRADLTVPSLETYGALIRVRDAAEACEVTDLIAPEHLHIQSRDARQLADQIRNAGATFIGPYAPVALGDYVAGPSHVLPTGGTARWASGLSSNHFLRSCSQIEYTLEALQQTAPDVARMADKELLTAHRASVDIRLPTSPRPGTPGRGPG
ncbi:MAG: histidinol dehydrogenase [Pirellulales bacterium]